MVLSALGIFMVVDSHTWVCFNLFGDFIPYNSFFMPMFVFISGYFNKVDASTKLMPYIWKKIKTLLIPYIGISLSVFGMQYLINWYKFGERIPTPPGYWKYALEQAVTVGPAVSLATPMWFVITLFALLVGYAILKKVLYRIWNSYVMIVLFTALHLFAVYVGIYADRDYLPPYLLPFKCLFFLPFIEMGILYREKLEKPHDSLSGGYKIALLFGLLVINLARTMYLPNTYDVAFDNIGELSGFTSPYIVTPMISSIVGILFWLTLVDLLGKAVYESRFVNYMSCNTFWIMGFHVAFFNILNCILMTIDKYILSIPYFSLEYFQASEWYRWEIVYGFKLVYLLIGILGPLGIKWIYDKILSLVSRTIRREKENVSEA